ncbi:MAG TPA: SusC/RagA family TonB-linked outer membrane protein [Prolixibacteraceae bacterium]|nr:SusC/RagA family TonB-linked outer membrane protein [Prolixibacteraceae bacterium]
MKRIALLLAFFAIGMNILWAQTRDITGSVTSADDGGSMPGVSISVKGTSMGTITDMNGKYSIKIPTDTKTLVFSFVGMTTQEITIGNQTTINVQLKSEDVTVDEVVIVAYGTAKKESLTGAISTVNSKSIESRPVSSVSGVLEGKAAGVQVNNTYGEPGSDATIRIRGFSSVNGSNAPLYVVDGVPYGGNVSDMNPQDIENITVLKDAASSALYGNRASNGVILITTKKGKTDGVGLRVNINQGVYNRGLKEYDRLGADDYMEVMWKGYRNNLMTAQAAKYPTAELAGAEASKSLVSNTLKYNIYNKPEAELFDANGKLVAGAQVHSGYNDLDWYEDIERLGHRQDYTVSGEGASAKSNYFFSTGYLDEKGYVESSDFKRFTGRTNINITPKKWIKAGLSLAGSHQVSNNTTGDAGSATTFINPFYYARNVAPIYPVYLHDMTTGDFILDANGAKQFDRGSQYARPQNLDRHIVWETQLNMDKTYRNTLQSQVFMDINFLNDFTFSLKGDMNTRATERQTYNNATIGDGAGNSGRASRTFYRYKIYTLQQQLNWNKAINLHNVDLFAGHESYNYNYAYTYGYKTTETFEGGTELINFTNITSLDGYQNNYRTESYLSRARYNYNNKYFAEASFRRDGSSRFYKDNRWGNFWSTGASWTISKEDFMASLQEQVNMLKLRASYGEVGNDASVDYYGYMALYAMEQNANKGAAFKTQNEALDIQWETSSSFGVALEGTFFNRANLSLEYFDKRSQDLLFDIYLPLSAGGTSTSTAEATITKNLGSVSNRGLELIFDVDVIKTKDLKWNLGINATTLTNKIVTLPEQNRKNGIVSGTKKYMEGHGIYDFWMFQYEGVDQMTGRSLYKPDLEKYYIGEAVEGKTQFPAAYLVTIGDKNYSTYTTYAAKDWSGSAIPDLFGSFSTSLSYKSFDLSMICTYSIGGKTLDYSYQSLMSVSATPHAIHSDVLNAWDGVPAGMTETSADRIDPNGVPVVNYGLSTFNDATSTRFLLDASYLVVKNIGLNYNFSKNFTNRLDISNLSASLSVENLATFTKMRGMNPQQSYAGTNDNAFVTARVFSLGINIKL